MNETIFEKLDGNGELSEEKVMELCKGSTLNTIDNLIPKLEDFSEFLRVMPNWTKNHDNFKYADLR